MLDWTHVLPVGSACFDASLRVHMWDVVEVPESIPLSPLLTLGIEICSDVDSSLPMLFPLIIFSSLFLLVFFLLLFLC